MTITLEVIRELFEDAEGCWAGCDWTTQHGATKLDLDGEDPDYLRRIADKMESGIVTDTELETVPQADGIFELSLLSSDYTEEEYVEAERDRYVLWISDLRSGADWLEEVQSDAAAAEESARQAVQAYERGDYAAAIKFADRASSYENTYGDDPTWKSFRVAVYDGQQYHEEQNNG